MVRCRDSACMRHSSPFHDHRWNRQLVSSPTKRLARKRPLDAFHLKKDSPWLNHGHPHLRRTLAFSHAGLGRFLGQGFVWENTNPNFAAAFKITRKRYASGFDFARAHPAALDRLEAKVAKSQCRTAVCSAAAASLLQFPIFDFFRFQHLLIFLSKAKRIVKLSKGAHAGSPP